MQIIPGVACGVGQGVVQNVPLLGCTPPAPSLPAFPAISTSGSFACIDNCQLPPQSFDASLSLGAPVLLSGDVYTIPLIGAVGDLDVGPDFTISAVLEAKYARTIKITSSTCVGPPPDFLPCIRGQVWRFLINADVVFTITGTTSACEVPPCFTTFPVHMVGHIDYAMVMSDLCNNNPTTAQWFHALSLTHLPGCVSHNALSTRSLTGAAAHVGQSFHLVTPSGFVWASSIQPPPVTNQPAFEGEDIRFSTLRQQQVVAEREQSIICQAQTLVPPPMPCPTFSPPSDLSLISATCLCQAQGDPIWSNMQLSGNWTVLRGPSCCRFQLCYCLQTTLGAFCPVGTTCPPQVVGTFQSSLVSGWPTGPGGLVGVGLGRYASGADFPFDQSLSVFWGGFSFSNEPCQQRSSVPETPEFITGVATVDAQNRYEVFQFRYADPTTCQGVLVDFQNAKIQQFDGGPWAIGWGSPFRADIVLSLNPQ